MQKVLAESYIIRLMHKNAAHSLRTLYTLPKGGLDAASFILG